MSNTDIQRLVRAETRIAELALEYGLDCYPQEFDVIPAQKMLEIMSYHFPVQYSHWSFGRNFEHQRTQYEVQGGGIPYEVVLNSNPSRAFLMNNNPYPIQVLVMAHVYGHNDFMKNNIHFKPTRKDMMSSASEAAGRFRNYEEQHGINAVEHILDAAHAIQYNIDTDFYINSGSPEEDREDAMRSVHKVDNSRYADFFNYGETAKTFDEKRSEKAKIKKKNPTTPQIDIMNFVMQNSPRGFEEWELDILSTIRDQSRYFAPQRKTKVMNEGWASFWHMTIMHRLFKEGFLTADEHGFYNLYNSRVIATNPAGLNPYLLGIKTFRNIKERWDKGHFGVDFDSSTNPDKWDIDLQLGKGTEKIFQVRKNYADWFFLDDFLNKQVIEESDLYIFGTQTYSNHRDYVIESTDPDYIKKAIVSSFSHSGIPLIKVEDGDYQGRRDLYLKHYAEGYPLDVEYARHTMKHLNALWGRPVFLETVGQDEDSREHKILYCHDGEIFKDMITGDEL